MACPDTYVISDLALGRQYAAQGFGVFFHYGIETYGQAFNYALPIDVDPKTQWPASLFNPTGTLDFHQWLLPAKMAGAAYANLTVKHAMGFCLWPSAHTTYTIANADASVSSRDLVDEFVTACREIDILPVLYYNITNREQNPTEATPGSPESMGRMDAAADLTFLKNQMTELLDGTYGDIHGIWLDHASHTTPANAKELYNHIKSLQPNCTVLSNHGPRFITTTGCNNDGLWDIVDGRSDIAVYERNTLPSPDYQLPLESVNTIYEAGNWFVYNDDTVPDVTAAEILASLNENLPYGAAYCLNLEPGTSGQINAAQCKVMRDLGVLRGVISNAIGVNRG